MLNKKFLTLIVKLGVISIVIHYLVNNIDLSFVENIYNYFYLIFILVPVFLIKLLTNSFKISYLLKIINKKSNKVIKIFEVLLVSQLSIAIPGSFFVRKTWVDLNIIKQNKLNFVDYIKFNIFTIITPLLTLLIIYFASSKFITLITVLLIFPFLLIFLRKYNNYYLYFIFFILNLILNIFMSFIIIFFINPDILEGNIVNIFLSSLISIYFDTISILPFNIGYSQMIYSLSFEYFSLPKDIALTIATIKQITHIVIIIFVLIFVSMKKKL